MKSVAYGFLVISALALAGCDDAETEGDTATTTEDTAPAANPPEAPTEEPATE